MQSVLCVSSLSRRFGPSGKESTGVNTNTQRHKGRPSPLGIVLTLGYTDRERPLLPMWPPYTPSEAVSEQDLEKGDVHGLQFTRN